MPGGRSPHFQVSFMLVYTTPVVKLATATMRILYHIEFIHIALLVAFHVAMTYVKRK